MARDMSFLNENIGFEEVATFGAGRMVPVLYATVDGGANWEQRTLPEGRLGAGIDFVSDTQGWALSPDSRGRVALYQTADGGRSWTSCGSNGMAGPAAGDHLEGVRFADPSHGWIGGYSGGRGTPQYYQTSDGCKTWTAVPLPRSTHVDYVDPPQRLPNGSLVGGLTAAGQLDIVEQDAAGGPWSVAAEVTNVAKGTASWSVAAGSVFVVAGGPATPSATPANVHRVAPYPGTTTTQFVDARDGFAVVDDMTTRVRSLYGTTDGGSSWKRVADLIGP